MPTILINIAHPGEPIVIDDETMLACWDAVPPVAVIGRGNGTQLSLRVFGLDPVVDDLNLRMPPNYTEYCSGGCSEGAEMSEPDQPFYVVEYNVEGAEITWRYFL